MADFEKLKTNIAKVKAIVSSEQPQTTVETTTAAPQEEAVGEYPLNQD